MGLPGITPHPRELERISALGSLQILDTPVEHRFEQITGLLRTVFDVPVSALSFVDSRRQWFKSIQGLRVEQTLRSIAFCQRVVCNEEVLVIPDARFDERFGHTELVTQDPGVVFYAGVPVYAPGGLPVASLCILDFEPRALDTRDIDILKQIAHLVESALITPRANTIEDMLITQVGESWRASMVDPLTRIWNSEGIQTLINEGVQYAKHKNQSIGVGMLELRGIQGIASTQGQAASDEFIFEFSRRSLQILKDFDSIGRLRFGEFGFMINRVYSGDDLYDRLAMLQQIADELCSTNQKMHDRVHACIGAYLIDPKHPTSAQIAMERAEELVTRASSDRSSHPLIAKSSDEDSDSHHRGVA